jgi:D-glycero-D-manno-heptose 1,7-bisphosphate phosphatase
MTRPAIFLDRDGTLNEDRGHVDRLDLLALFPWTADALRLIRRAGFATVVITNQSGIARGMLDERFLDAVHREIDRRLAPAGAAIDRYYHCPHLPESKRPPGEQPCRCRKPAPGLIEQACRELDIDPARSVMVGDRWADVACGRGAGTRAVLVRTGHGLRESRQQPPDLHADAILNNLMEAVGWILRHCSRW